MMKRIFCILFCILMAISLINVASATEDGYMTFKPYGIYKTKAPLDVIPVTYEAWVRIPEGRTGASDVVISNSNSYYISSFQVHIDKDGAPAITFVNKVPDGPQYSYKTYTFSNSAVNTGEWTHVAIVADVANKKVSCYINGELSESKSFTYVPLISPLPLVLGGVNLGGNSDFFKGQLFQYRQHVALPQRTGVHGAAVKLGMQHQKSVQKSGSLPSPNGQIHK